MHGKRDRISQDATREIFQQGDITFTNNEKNEKENIEDKSN